MDISYDKIEHKFLVQYDDGSCFLASYDDVIKLLRKMADLPEESYRQYPTQEELEEFWASPEWKF